MSRWTDIYGFAPVQITVPAGGTNAILVTPVAGMVAGTIKIISGSSLEILQCPVGTTLTGATLATMQGTGYLLGTSEVFNYGGAARYYLCATGATAVAHLLQGMGPGF